MPTESRQSVLERNIVRWVRVVDRIAARLSVLGLPSQLHQLASGHRDVDEWIIDAHLLGVALRQIDQHLQHLGTYRTDRLAIAARGYLAEYESLEIKNLRDVLEHEAEYIAEAKTARLPQTEYVLDPAAPVSFGSATGSGRGRIFVYVFGREYRVDALIEKAVVLGKLLAES
jgi:hypothetical protein